MASSVTAYSRDHGFVICRDRFVTRKTRKVCYIIIMDGREPALKPGSPEGTIKAKAPKPRLAGSTISQFVSIVSFTLNTARPEQKASVVSQMGEGIVYWFA